MGKAVTIGYALLGIPLTMLYLTSVGSLLSRVARGAFSRALCCCLCSNCGYCCYDERRMAEKERRMKMKRQQEEMRSQQQNQAFNQTQKVPEAFYVVRSTEALGSNQNKEADKSNLNKDGDNISWPDTDSKLSMQGLSILAPILLCLCTMFIYIVIGTIVLYKIDNLRPIDGFYFCFMSLSTIGFGHLIPGQSKTGNAESTVLWFCSIYILSGLALTAMCFNVVHDEIIHRLKHQQKEWSQKGNAIKDEVNLRDPFYIAS
jgi:potassium channel subfamily K member 18